MVGLPDHEGSTMLSERFAHAPSRQPTSTVEHLRQQADEFGQMDLGDPRWLQLTPVLDRALRDVVTMSEDPRAAIWEEIVDDSETPLVVKLRAFTAMLSTLP
jgi:hypothetical protein